MDDAPDDPAGLEQQARQRMEEAGAAIVAGVEQHAADWVVRAVTDVCERWGQLSPAARDAAIANAHDAGKHATLRVVADLRAFFALDPARQRTTPLAIVRSLRIEATEVLIRVGVPPITRDEFEIRAFPDDIYAIVPRDLAELGDDDLAPMLLVWGLGKAAVLRARSKRDEGS